MRFNPLHFFEKIFAAFLLFVIVGLLSLVLVRPELIFEPSFNSQELNIKIPEVEVNPELLDQEIPETPSIDEKDVPESLKEPLEDYYGDDFKSSNPNTVSDQLTIDGVVEYTNKERTSRGLAPLENNETLNLIAYQRAKEMFDREYFAHESPTGKTAEVLVAASNYDYLLVGENLAKGIFDSNRDLVDGWMNSPEHKENILKEGFEEIGVAAVEGTYEGRKIWIAVQIFATPASSCPQVDESLLNAIESNQKELSNLAEEINKLNSEISNSESRREYNQKIDEYNDLVKEYNILKEKLETQIDSYNNQVNEKNACLEEYKE